MALSQSEVMRLLESLRRADGVEAIRMAVAAGKRRRRIDRHCSPW